jgi:hypothetical protein
LTIRVVDMPLLFVVSCPVLRLVSVCVICGSVVGGCVVCGSVVAVGRRLHGVASKVVDSMTVVCDCGPGDCTTLGFEFQPAALSPMLISLLSLMYSPVSCLIWVPCLVSGVVLGLCVWRCVHRFVRLVSALARWLWLGGSGAVALAMVALAWWH